MGKCSKCGKSGLFLKLNESGLCKDCALEVTRAREIGLAAARAFLEPISAAFFDILNNGGRFPASSWVDTKDVPLACVSRLLDDCSFICSEFPRWAEYPYFEEVFLEECSPHPKISSCYEHPYIKLGLLRKSGNDFDKLIPDLLKSVRSLSTALVLYGEYEYKTCRIVGVTFDNEDGHNRQEILKKIRYRGAPYRTDPEIRLVKYNHNGDEAVAVYANEEQIGHISQFNLSDVLPRWDRYKDVSHFSIHGDGSRTNKFGMDIEIRFRKPE